MLFFKTLFSSRIVNNKEYYVSSLSEEFYIIKSKRSDLFFSFFKYVDNDKIFLQESLYKNKFSKEIYSYTVELTDNTAVKVFDCYIKTVVLNIAKLRFLKIVNSTNIDQFIKLAFENNRNIFDFESNDIDDSTCSISFRDYDLINNDIKDSINKKYILSNNELFDEIECNDPVLKICTNSRIGKKNFLIGKNENGFVSNCGLQTFHSKNLEDSVSFIEKMLLSNSIFQASLRKALVDCSIVSQDAVIQNEHLKLYRMINY